MLYELWQLWREGKAVGADCVGRFLCAAAARDFARTLGVGTFRVTDEAGGEHGPDLLLGPAAESRRRPARLDGVPLRRVRVLADGTLDHEAAGPLPAA